MPPVFVPGNKVVKLDLINKLFGNEVVNEFFIKMAVTITTTVLSDVADALHGWFVSNLFLNQSQRLNHGSVRATDLTTATSPSIINTYTPGTGGVAEATGQPSNVAIALTKRTLKRGRSYRGRNFIGGIPAAAFVSGDADTVNSTFISDVLADYAALAAAITAVDPAAQVGVFSRIQSGAPLTNGIFTEISSYAMNDKMDSMRRRLTGRGA